MAITRIPVFIEGDERNFDKFNAYFEDPSDWQIDYAYYLFIDNLFNGLYDSAILRLNTLLDFFASCEPEEDRPDIHIKLKMFACLLSKFTGDKYYNNYQLLIKNPLENSETLQQYIKENEDELTDPDKKFIELAKLAQRLLEERQPVEIDMFAFHINLMANAEIFLLQYNRDFYSPVKMKLPPMVKAKYPSKQDAKFFLDRKKAAKTLRWVEELIGKKRNKEQVDIPKVHEIISQNLYQKFHDSIIFLGRLWHKTYRDKGKVEISTYIPYFYGLISTLFIRLISDEPIVNLLDEKTDQLQFKTLGYIKQLANTLLIELNRSDKFKNTTLSYHDFMVHKNLLELIFDCTFGMIKCKSFIAGTSDEQKKLREELFLHYYYNAILYKESCPKIAIVYTKKAINLSKMMLDDSYKEQTDELILMLATLYKNNGQLTKAIKIVKSLTKKHAGPEADKLLDECTRLSLIRGVDLGNDIKIFRELLQELTLNYQTALLSSNLSSKTMPLAIRPKITGMAKDLVSLLDKGWKKYIRRTAPHLSHEDFQGLYFPHCMSEPEFLCYLVSNKFFLPENSFFKNDAQYYIDIFRQSQAELITYTTPTTADYRRVLESELMRVDLLTCNLTLFKSRKDLESQISDTELSANTGKKVCATFLAFGKLCGQIERIVTSSTTRMDKDLRDLEEDLLARLPVLLLSECTPEKIKASDFSAQDFSRKFIEKYNEYKGYEKNIKKIVEKVGVVDISNIKDYFEREVKKFDFILIDKLVDASILVRRSYSVHYQDENDLTLKLNKMNKLLIENIEHRNKIMRVLGDVKSKPSLITDDKDAKKKLDTQLVKICEPIARYYDPFEFANITRILERHGWAKSTNLRGDVLVDLTDSYQANDETFKQKFDVAFVAPGSNISLGPTLRTIIHHALKDNDKRRITTLPKIVIDFLREVQPFNRNKNKHAMTWWVLNEIANTLKHSGPLEFLDNPASALSSGVFNSLVNFSRLRPRYEAEDLLLFLSKLSTSLTDETVKDLAKGISQLLKNKYLKEVTANEGTYAKYHLVKDKRILQLCENEGLDDNTKSVILLKLRAELSDELCQLAPDLDLSKSFDSLPHFLVNFLISRKSQELGLDYWPESATNLERLLNEAKSFITDIFNILFIADKESSSPEVVEITKSELSPKLADETTSVTPAALGLTTEASDKLAVEQAAMKEEKTVDDIIYDILRMMPADGRGMEYNYFGDGDFVEDYCNSAEKRFYTDDKILTLEEGDSVIKQIIPKLSSATLIRKLHNRFSDLIDKETDRDVLMAIKICFTIATLFRRFHPPLAYYYFKKTKKLSTHYDTSERIDSLPFSFGKGLLLIHRVNYWTFNVLDTLIPRYDMFGYEFFEFFGRKPYPLASWLKPKIYDNELPLACNFEDAWWQLFRLYYKTLLFSPADQTQDELDSLQRRCYKVLQSLRELRENIYVSFLNTINDDYTQQASFPSSPNLAHFDETLKKANLGDLKDSSPSKYQLLLSTQKFSGNQSWMFCNRNCFDLLTLLSNADKHAELTTLYNEELAKWQRKHNDKLHSQFCFIVKEEDGKEYLMPALPFLFETLINLAKLMNNLFDEDYDIINILKQMFSWTSPGQEATLIERATLSAPARDLTTAIPLHTSARSLKSSAFVYPESSQTFFEVFQPSVSPTPQLRSRVGAQRKPSLSRTDSMRLSAAPFQFFLPGEPQPSAQPSQTSSRVFTQDKV